MIQKAPFSTFSALLDLFGFINDNNTSPIIKSIKRAEIYQIGRQAVSHFH